MAEPREPHNEAASTGRLYKAKDVHRRRAGAKAREASSGSVTGEISVSDAQADQIPQAFQASQAARVSRNARTSQFVQSSQPAQAPQAAQVLDAAQTEGVGAEAGEASGEARPPSRGGLRPPSATGGEGAQRAPLLESGEEASLPGPETSEPLHPSSTTTSDAPQPAKPRRKRRKPTWRGVLLAVLLVVLLVVVGAGAAFAWDRWGRYDDHADMQGEWYAAGTASAVVSIDAGAIQLTEDVSYSYEIDDHAKTISYTFGPMAGQGRYWFSADRRFLVIVDGEGYNGAITALEDIRRLAAGEAQLAPGSFTALEQAEGTVVLCREPGKLALRAKEAAEKGKQRAKQKAAREEAEAAREAAEQELQEEQSEETDDIAEPSGADQADQADEPSGADATAEADQADATAEADQADATAETDEALDVVDDRSEDAADSE